MPLVLALGDIVVALVAVLLLYAAYQLFHNFLVSLVNRIPLVGRELALLTDAILYDMEQGAISWAKDSVKALVAIVMAPVHWIESIVNYVYGGIHSLFAALSILRYVTIPALINGVLSTAHGWIAQLQGYTVALFNQAQGYALGLYNSAITFTRQEIALTDQYALSLYDDSITFTTHEIQLTQAYAQSLYTDAINFTTSSVGTLEKWTATSITAVQTGLSADISALSKWIAQELPLVYTYVNTAVGAVEADLTELKTECTDNLCSGLSPLASLFNALSGDLGIAALIALAAQAAHDPQGTGHLISEVFGPIARDGATIMRDTIGI